LLAVLVDKAVPFQPTPLAAAAVAQEALQFYL